MLKLESDFSRSFPISTHTERDAEVPLLLEFINKVKPIESLIDIGAHHSSYNYAKEIRPFVKTYHAVDILPDPETSDIVDNYTVGNANDSWLDSKLNSYECVISVSVLEHTGISTYRADYQEERYKLFKKMLDLATKRLWLSFDIGQQYIYPGELAPVTHEEFKRWMELTKGMKIDKKFLYSQGIQAGHPIYMHEKEDVAFRIPYIDYVGNQSVCVLEIEK